MNISDPYFSPLLPTTIDAPGEYVTRCGEVVTVERRSLMLTRWNGSYDTGVTETWHKSGRIYPSTETKNDIVRKAP